MWMSHGDQLGPPPASFHAIATTKDAPFAGIAHETKAIYGIQFHTEVTHTLRRTKLLETFIVRICGVRQDWAMANFIDKYLEPLVQAFTTQMQPSSCTRLSEIGYRSGNFEKWEATLCSRLFSNFITRES